MGVFFSVKVSVDELFFPHFCDKLILVQNLHAYRLFHFLNNVNHLNVQFNHLHIHDSYL